MNNLTKYCLLCLSLVAELATGQTVTIEGVIRVGKDWTEVTSAVVDAETGSGGVASRVVFEGTTQSTLTASASSLYNDIEVNKTAATTPDKYLQLATNATLKNQLTLTAGVLNLNAKTLTLNNNSASGITFSAGAGIFAETAPTDVYILGGSPGPGYGYVKWKITNTTGDYIVPFVTSAGSDVRLRYNISTAGNAGGQVNFSTYGTAANNQPWASGVTQFDAGGADGSAKVANRFYIVEQNSFSTRPKGWLSFKYLTSELDAGIVEARLAAQRFNTGNESWGDWLYSPTANTATKTVSIFMANNPDYYDAWVLSDQATPLPIELISFDAKALPNQVDLNWTTASETNVDYFTIQRTIDGAKFDDISKVAALGFSNSNMNYSTVDPNPYVGVSYYRLKTTDKDGQVEYSELKAVQYSKTMSNRGIEIYPNPIKGNVVNLELKGFDKESVAHIEIQDLSGRTLVTQSTVVGSDQSQRLTLNELKLASGVYLLRVSAGSNFFSKKIVVE